MKYIKFLSVLVTIFFSMTNVVFADNISIKDFEIKPGSTETVELALTNATLVKDFSVDIYLPDGLTFENNDASSVVFTDAVVGGDPKSGSIRKNGALRLVVYDGKIQPGTDVVIVKFNVTASDSFTSGIITTDMTQIGDDDEIPSISVNVTKADEGPVDDHISISDFDIVKGKTQTVKLALTNATLVKDFSVDIYLPDGLTFKDNDASSVVFTDAVVGGDPKSGSIRKNGALRLVVYDGKIQPGKNVVIVTFDVTAAEDFESGVITTDMTQIGDDDEIPSISVNVRGVNATSIDNAIVNVENNAVVYDLVGRQVNANAKGILIKNGKKFIVK